jgi:hypothetical protein
VRKEIEMAVVAVAVLAGGNQETYENISARVLSGGQLPDGCQLHVAGPVDEGWRIITVWDSPEDLERFRNEKLLPGLRDAGVEDELVPQVNPAHRVITA